MRLGRRGAVVAILGRSEDKAKLVAAEVEAAGGTQWTAIVDIADMTAVSEVVAQFAAKFGGIDTVVSSAGIASTGTLTSTEPDEWHRIIDTNLNGTYYLARVHAGTGKNQRLIRRDQLGCRGAGRTRLWPA